MSSSMSSSSLPQKAPNGRLMDLRRQAQLVRGGLCDHTGECHEADMPDFDITKTIFKTMDAAFVPMIKKKFAKILFWSDRAIDRIRRSAAELLNLSDGPSSWAGLPAHSPALLAFMEKDCEFDCEHADGSFLDHLQFCYEYLHVYFPAASPVVGFLHSIMGVGTNLFPMLLEQRARLAELVSAEELTHIECFPTVLRLLQIGLVDELVAMPAERLHAISGLRCHRLLGPQMRELMRSDNAPLLLATADQFWTHLNYHMVHFLDFLPAVDWKDQLTIGLFPLFIALHGVLTRAGQLRAHISFDAGEEWVTAQFEADRTTAEFAAQMQTNKAMALNFSAKVGHSLDYELFYKC